MIGRGGTVLASFRCNLALKEVGKGFPSFAVDLMVGIIASVSVHSDLASVDVLESAVSTVFRKVDLKRRR